MPAGVTAGFHPDLKEMWVQIDRIAEDARNLTGQLDEAQFNWPPEPGRRWSIAQCISHLNVAGGLYLPMVDRAIRESRGKGLTGEGPYKHPFLGAYFVRLTEPPPKRRFKAPASMQPASNEKKEATMAEFFRVQDRVRACLQSANGLDLGRIRVRSPISPLLRFSLGQAFALTTGHERRHLWQAWQVRNHAQFPAA